MNAPAVSSFQNILINKEKICVPIFVPLQAIGNTGNANPYKNRFEMNNKLIEKYNISVPRYTSYPPANYFREFGEEEYVDAVICSNNARNGNVSFYIHIPYCRRLCHYCGCNSYAMQKEDRIGAYIDALHREIELVARHISKDRKISQIHYGGGSPTAMPVGVLKELNEHLLSLLPTIGQPEIAIECHPGFLTHKDWEGLAEARFNRFSIGVQDFDTEVLKAVNREPSALPMEEIFGILRSAGASINMDFLFGLPGQTPESFNASIKKAVSLRPDRLTTFSYGHCPWIFKRQLILEKQGLPSAEDKAEMFRKAKETLTGADYLGIGLDHFVLPDDELATALKTHKLHRNFQGYCTRRTTAQVYAFGVTGISQLETAYAQNSKVIPEYIDEVSAGRLPIKKGYLLSAQEQIAREVIETLMCNYHIDWSEIAQSLSLDTSTIKQAVNYDEARLSEMQTDGILRFNDAELTMTEDGNPFVRNVAATLDPLMINTTRKFSKPI